MSSAAEKPIKVPMKADDEPVHWLVKPENIKKMWRYGIVILAFLTLGDLALHPHPHFWVDGTFGFHSWYGFLTCLAMVLVAKGLGIVLKREDTYYDK